jgi:type II secretory pathway pseudopilin PulG
MVVVVVAALSLGACTSTANQAAAREKAATKLTCAAVNSAIANQRTDTQAQWIDTIQSIVVNAKGTGNKSLVSDARQMQAAEATPPHPGPDVTGADNQIVSVAVVSFLRTCDALGLGATF